MCLIISLQVTIMLESESICNVTIMQVLSCTFRYFITNVFPYSKTLFKI